MRNLFPQLIFHSSGRLGFLKRVGHPSRREFHRKRAALIYYNSPVFPSRATSRRHYSKEINYV